MQPTNAVRPQDQIQAIPTRPTQPSGPAQAEPHTASTERRHDAAPGEAPAAERAATKASAVPGGDSELAAAHDRERGRGRLVDLLG